jgi:hypothetical protein
MIPTSEEYVVELNRYATPQIAELIKVSPDAVETWKAGQPSGWPVQWRRVIEILREKGTPVA